MNTLIVIKVICFFFLVASGEMLNGIARTLYLNKRIGVKHAKRISIVPALLLCLLISYWYIPTTGITSNGGLLALGTALSLFMLLFDIVIGTLVLGARLSAVMADLDISKGNLLGLGLIAMAFCPLLSSILHRAF